MKFIDEIKQRFNTNGFAIVNDVFTEAEVDDLISVIDNADSTKSTFRKTADLFAIRRFFQETPYAAEKVFTRGFTRFIIQLFGKEFFTVKSIYFDKPKTSNWFVAYHQDLTISVDKRLDVEGFGPWTTKPGGFAVQPPASILEDNFTVRIHLDDTNEENGALKVIPGSHLNGVCKPNTVKSLIEEETICNVQKGGIMLMKPLLLHSSGRTTNGNRRRVIHIEFSRSLLPEPLHWAERAAIKSFS